MLTEVDRPVITVAVGCGNVKSELRNGKASWRFELVLKFKMLALSFCMTYSLLESSRTGTVLRMLFQILGSLTVARMRGIRGTGNVDTTYCSIVLWQ